MSSEVSAAELKVVLDGLGLSPPWFAQRLGVTRRTVTRWIDNEGAPRRAIEELDHLSELTLDEMRLVLSEIDDEAEDVTIRTYRTNIDMPDRHRGWPATWHRALTFRVVEHLRASGANVHVEYVQA